MDLILWRHAEAFDSAGGLDDLEQTLTPKGEKQARHMAQWLDRHLPAGVRVMASPAVRAQQTAAALERKVKTAADLAPGASVESLLHAVRWPEPAKAFSSSATSRRWGWRWPTFSLAAWSPGPYARRVSGGCARASALASNRWFCTP